MMTKFVSKRQEIEAEQFFPESSVWPKQVSRDGGKYWVFNKAHASYLQVHPGDWVREDNPNDTYPITDEDMKDRYEKIS